MEGVLAMAVGVGLGRLGGEEDGRMRGKGIGV